MAASSASRIAVIGAGSVGSTIAYSLIVNPIASEILIVDPSESMLKAQVQDLSDATFHSSNAATHIRAGSHKEAGQADIIVMTAGAPQKEGESRTDLIGKNKKILKSAIDDMKPLRKDVVLLIVANPVDVLTYYAQTYAGLPKSQVFGSGTFLDSARLAGDLSAVRGVSASSITAYVLGEHGESQVVAWSHVSIGGVPLSQSKAASVDKDKIAKETKGKATEIMEAKGATAFGVAGTVGSICRSVLFDEKAVRPMSVWREDEECCYSWPVVVGRKGIVEQLIMELDEGERSALRKSVESLKTVIADSEKD